LMFMMMTVFYNDRSISDGDATQYIIITLSNNHCRNHCTVTSLS